MKALSPHPTVFCPYLPSKEAIFSFLFLGVKFVILPQVAPLECSHATGLDRLR